MNNVFLDLGSSVTVAVALDRHSLQLTEAAAQICRRTGKRLCLLHVVEPWAEMPPSRPFASGDPLWDVMQAVESEARAKASARLEELAATVGTDVKVEMRIVAGKAVDAIMREVSASPTCLLLVGANYDNVRLLPKGLSTAMSLVVAAPVPVLVVDTSLVDKVLGSPARILVADDLGDHTEAAIEFAFAFGAALGDVDVRHVHVNGLTLPALQAGLATAAAASHTPVDATASAGRVYEAMLEDLQRRLGERAENQTEYLEAAGGTYTAEVRTGKVHEQLEEVAAAFTPDLLVFGRHHAYHKRPFFVGRLPYRAMLSYRRPLLIVPSERF